MGFWRTATLDTPIVIIGGGRWGRTWASVAIAARGSGKNLTIASRTDPDAVRAWVTTLADANGLTVVTSVAEAMQLNFPPTAAIIASRPRDHVRDSLEALQLGLHVLVEKPIGIDMQGGQSLVAAAQAARRVLAMGTEFAYLPVLYQLARQFESHAGLTKLRLTWEDPPNELRHGAPKIRHEEVGLLQDLLPHAFSIFQIFAPRAQFRIVAAHESAGGGQGSITFVDDANGHYELHCDVASTSRRRLLEIQSGGVHASVDFSDNIPSITMEGHSYPLDPQFASMASTLRLELGAFLATVTGEIDATFITTGISSLLLLQAELEQALDPSVD